MARHPLREPLPPFITFSDAARIMGMGRLTVTTWAKNNGLVTIVGKSPYIDVGKLKKAFPEVFQRVLESVIDPYEE